MPSEREPSYRAYTAAQTIRAATLGGFDESELPKVAAIIQRAIDETIAPSRHYHVNVEGSDTCKACGRDLRDEIHLRVGETP